MANNATPFPPPNLPFSNLDGTPERNWYELLLKLFERTGGVQPPADVADLIQQIIDALAQAEMQAVTAQTPAIKALQQAVEELRKEQASAQHLSLLQQRLSDLENLVQVNSDTSALMQKLGELEQMICEIKQPVSVVLEQWNAPTLTNSWVYYGSPTNPVGYWKDPNGVVHLRGAVKSGTIGLSVFTLPVGYRPSNTEYFAVVSNGAFGRVVVGSDGGVTPDIGSNVYVTLDGITFRAAT